MPQALLCITGRVQGVFYRDNAQEKAQALGLTGYIKNMPDNSVEALVQGEKEKIQAFAEWCKEGPSSAKVDQVEISWQEPQETFTNFEITY
jgi:acylphosphatase